MAAKLLNYTKSYFLILGMSLRSRMSFRLDFFIMLFSVFFREFANLSLLIVVVQRFENLAGWTMWEMAFLYCIVTFTQRNFSSFTGGIMSIGKMVQSGEMDSYLMTPLSPLFLLNSRNTMVWRMFYNIGIFILLIFCGIQAGISFSVTNILFFLVMMVSSMVVMASVFLIVSTLSFFTIDISAAIMTLDEIVRKYMVYPIGIYGSIASFLLTFLIPLGFISYYPASFLLDKTKEVLYHPYLPMLTPVVAIVFLLLALAFWKIGLKNYKSTGT